MTSVTEFSQYRCGPQIPTRPRQRRLAIHIFRVDYRSCVQPHLNRFLIAEGRRTMQRCFAFGPAIAHESAGLGIVFRNAIHIRAMRKKHLHHQVMRQTPGGAQCRVQSRLAGVSFQVDLHPLRVQSRTCRAASARESTLPLIPD